MVKQNSGLKIINATLTMDYDNSQNDLWLSPANLLMISQNIKNGLIGAKKVTRNTDLVIGQLF